MNSIQKVFSPLTDFLRSNMANAAGAPVAWSEMGNSALYRIVDASQLNISMQPAMINE